MVEGSARPYTYNRHLRVNEVGDADREGRSERDAERRWLKRGRVFEEGGQLRVMVEAATGRAITDRWGNELGCGESGWVEGHNEVNDRYRFVVHSCRVRGRCPRCGESYGREQGAELVSIMAAALSRVKEASEVLGWGIVLTVPSEVSERIGELVDRGRAGVLVRREINRLVALGGRVVEWLFGVERGRLGVGVNVHYWSSSEPVREAWHWHLHLLVPNVDREGRVLRKWGRFTGEELSELRERVSAEMRAMWPEVVSGFEANVHVRFFTSDAVGRRKWAHRLRYDSRHPWGDVRVLMGSVEGCKRLFGDGLGVGLCRIAARIERLQAVKLRRYLGWLAPGQRRLVGIMRGEAEVRVWSRIEDGWRRIVAWTVRGLRVVGFGMHAGRVSEVPRDCVVIRGQSPPVRWCVRGE